MGRGFGSYELVRGNHGPVTVFQRGKIIGIMANGEKVLECDVYLGKIKLFGCSQYWRLNRHALAINRFLDLIECKRYYVYLQKVSEIQEGSTHSWHIIVADVPRNTKTRLPHRESITIGIPVKCVINIFANTGNMAMQNIVEDHNERRRIAQGELATLF